MFSKTQIALQLNQRKTCNASLNTHTNQWRKSTLINIHIHTKLSETHMHTLRCRIACRNSRTGEDEDVYVEERRDTVSVNDMNHTNVGLWLVSSVQRLSLIHI